MQGSCQSVRSTASLLLPQESNSKGSPKCMLYFFLRLCSQYLKVQCWSCSHSPIALQKKQFYKIRSLQLPISTDMQGLPRTVSTYHHRQSTDRSTSLCNDTNDPLDAIPKALLKMWSGFHLDTSNAKSTRICLVTNASDPSLHPFRKLQPNFNWSLPQQDLVSWFKSVCHLPGIHQAVKPHQYQQVPLKE